MGWTKGRADEGGKSRENQRERRVTRSILLDSGGMVVLENRQGDRVCHHATAPNHLPAVKGSEAMATVHSTQLRGAYGA